MSKPQVLFATARALKFDHSYSLVARFQRMLEALDLGAITVPGAPTPIKIHFGSRGAVHVVRPAFVAHTVRALQAIPCQPFVTDSCRMRGLEYLKIARMNGYDTATVGAPVVLADGVFGNDSVLVPAGRLLGEVSVASAIHDAECMVVISHFKGHMAAGVGGAVKNLAMGGVTGKPRCGTWHQGRGKAHFLLGTKVEWRAEPCTLCQTCVRICPVDAIREEDGCIVIDHDRCWRCGRCITCCPEHALYAPKDDDAFQEALAEQAAAVLSTFEAGRVLYLNFLLHMQPECDCMDIADVPVVQDLGILAGTDPVAVDTASLDLVARQQPLPGSRAEGLELRPGQDIFSALHQKNPRGHLEHLARKGYGSTAYELVDVP
jgi:hypothetical protein